jgi:hypothetical protein
MQITKIMFNPLKKWRKVFIGSSLRFKWIIGRFDLIRYKKIQKNKNSNKLFENSNKHKRKVLQTLNQYKK